MACIAGGMAWKTLSIVELWHYSVANKRPYAPQSWKWLGEAERWEHLAHAAFVPKAEQSPVNSTTAA
jgi:hypothetical protein